MMINEITREAGAHKRRKRIGRGEASGQGTTAGKGHKGQLARSGGKSRPMTEGGQMPIFRRLPKRGFSNVQFATPIEIVNLSDLARAFDDGAQVGLDELRAARLIRSKRAEVKVLAKGKLEKKLSVAAHRFSEKAKSVIEQAGGSVEVVAVLDKAAAAKSKRHSAKDRKREKKPTRLERKRAQRESAGS